MSRGSARKITRKVYEYLNRFGKCYGCKRLLSVELREEPWTRVEQIHLSCEKCDYHNTERAMEGETVAQVIARVDKSTYVRYQKRIVDRLRGTA